MKPSSAPGPAAPEAPFRFEPAPASDGSTRLRLSGVLRFVVFHRAFAALREAAVAAGRGPVEFDLSAVERLDGGSAALLVELLGELRAQGRTVELVGAREAVAALLELSGVDDERSAGPTRPPRAGAIEQIGAATAEIAGRLRDVADFTGRFVLSTSRALRAPGSVPWSNLWRLVERHGADAVPIVLVINLLVGVILAFQSAGQLERFGAEVFVANLVGLSVVRELGPLMTAILVAGRSGAAFAAELGTMRVSEEVDALRTLGISPTAYLVLPRFLALAVALPLLTLIADAAGVAGGLAIGVVVLDLTTVGYWNQTLDAIGGWDVGTGLLKSVAFAATVATIACQRGLATRGGAEGVGRSTTSAVVTCIFCLVALDAALTWLFSLYAL